MTKIRSITKNFKLECQSLAPRQQNVMQQNSIIAESAQTTAGIKSFLLEFLLIVLQFIDPDHQETWLQNH